MKASVLFKTICFAIVFVASTSKVNAQYYVPDYVYDYSPGGVIWCAQMDQRITSMQIKNNIMRQQVLNYYRQQAATAYQWLQTNPVTPMPGVMTYDGTYVTPNTVNDYHKENVTCEHCDGGYNYRTIYMGDGETQQIKSRCNWCYGKGYLTKTVKNE